MEGEYFSPKDFAVFTGATCMIVAATKTVKNIIPRINARFIAFVFSLVIAVVNVLINDKHNWLDWALLFFNACLLYCAALGLNETIANTSPEIRNMNPTAETDGWRVIKGRWLRSWFN